MRIFGACLLQRGKKKFMEVVHSVAGVLDGSAWEVIARARLAPPTADAFSVTPTQEALPGFYARTSLVQHLFPEVVITTASDADEERLTKADATAGFTAPAFFPWLDVWVVRTMLPDHARSGCEAQTLCRARVLADALAIVHPSVGPFAPPVSKTTALLHVDVDVNLDLDTQLLLHFIHAVPLPPHVTSHRHFAVLRKAWLALQPAPPAPPVRGPQHSSPMRMPLHFGAWGSS